MSSLILPSALDSDPNALLALLSQVSYVDAWRARLQEDYAFFVREFWSEIEGDRPLVWNWHLDWLCEALTALRDGQIRRLLICMPPRHLKSTFCSVLFQPWVWLTDPRTRWLTGAYAEELAERDCVRSRRVISSPLYELAKGNANPWGLAPDQNQKQKFENTEQGWRIISSVNKGTTGRGGDYVTCDDAHDARKVESDAERKKAHDWWFKVMSTRLDHPKTGRRLAIMQRTHVDDVAGAIIEAGNYETIVLKTLYECDEPGRRTVQALGLEDPRTEEGELLCEEHFGDAEVADAKADLGEQGFSAQHQQSPIPPGGGILKKAWFRRWLVQPVKFDMVIQSWDLTFGGTSKEELLNAKEPSWVAGACFGKLGPRLYLLGEKRRRCGFLDSIAMITDMLEEFPLTRKIIIEKKANGAATIEVLQGEIAGVVPWDPQRASKVQRAQAASPFVEGGGLWLPDESHGGWVKDWGDEVSAFPFGKASDRVDTLTQAVLSECLGTNKSAVTRLRNLTRY